MNTKRVHRDPREQSQTRHNTIEYDIRKNMKLVLGFSKIKKNLGFFSCIIVLEKIWILFLKKIVYSDVILQRSLIYLLATDVAPCQIKPPSKLSMVKK